ncbi:hypothetical protein PPYR_13211 [Photinus pyralis]|uniref:Uncharacterized protein n=1 Tax=Photinus pyralis TaxID=7054 RepID=A0A5N4A8D7_PHOPY|nr:uncharacterized protein LOC116178205 [Photinus pyralis]XP_031354954.1 uncharacterized protein LOC116179325 [Photinus pyralis]KAB0793591.1 hypothetical protein PPYR_13211 [Photinus pyralis]
MKIALIILLCFYATTSLQDSVREATVKANSKACSKELMVDTSLAKRALKSGNAGNDTTVKCFFKCVLEKDGTMTTTGELNLMPFRDRLVKATEMMDACSALKAETPCDLAFNAMTCIRNAFMSLE